MTEKATGDRELAHLVSMANDIAANLGRHPDAADRIADHINRFWAPRMRAKLLEYARENGRELTEAMKPALKKLKI